MWASPAHTGSAAGARVPGQPRQLEGKGRAAPGLALYVESAPVRLDDGLGDEEAEPGASSVCVPVAIENVWKVLGFDSRAGVGNLERNVRIAIMHAQPYLPPFGGKLQCVADQV